MLSFPELPISIAEAVKAFVNSEAEQI